MVSLRAAILAATHAIEEAREPLCALDATTGDGDHGLTMAIGARGVRRSVAAVEGDDASALVRAAATGMSSAGGAIGPLYGKGLLAVASQLDGARCSTDRERVALLRRSADAAVAEIEALGGAKAGDKTILDALLPVASALGIAELDGVTLEAALDAAVAAARAGADSTTGMAARVGRSSRFGERSVGSADPGATSFALIVDALVANAR